MSHNLLRELSERGILRMVECHITLFPLDIAQHLIFPSVLPNRVESGYHDLNELQVRQKRQQSKENMP